MCSKGGADTGSSVLSFQSLLVTMPCKSPLSVTSVRFPIPILLTRGRLSEEKMISETSVMF